MTLCVASPTGSDSGAVAGLSAQDLEKDQGDMVCEGASSPLRLSASSAELPTL